MSSLFKIVLGLLLVGMAVSVYLDIRVKCRYKKAKKHNQELKGMVEDDH